MKNSLIVSILLILLLMLISSFQQQLPLSGFILLSDIISPPAGQITVVGQNDTFTVNAKVTCLDVTCNSVNTSIRRNSTTINPDKLISENIGDTPFYIMSPDVGGYKYDNWYFSFNNEIPSWSRGMEFNGTYFWIVSYSDKKVYRYDSTGNYNNSYFTTLPQIYYPFDITLNNTYFWVTGYFGSAKVYRYDEYGVYNNSFFYTEFHYPFGITFDGTHFWIVEREESKVARYTSDGVYDNWFFSTTDQDTKPYGIESNGTYFWILGSETKKIYRYKADGTYDNWNFPVNDVDSTPEDMSFDGTYFWVIGREKLRVYRYAFAEKKQNTQSCGNMNRYDICYKSWTINATGPTDSIWGIDVNVSSTTGQDANNSLETYIRIGSISGTPDLTLRTDKENYKPGDTVKFNLTSDTPASQIPTISIFSSNGDSLAPDVAMEQVNSTYWKINYSIGTTDAPNGVYNGTVKFVKEGQTFTTGKTFNVNAWNLSVDTDALEYNVSDDVGITISTTNSYKNNLDIDINITIVYPDSTEEEFDTDTLTGNDEYSKDFTLPSDAPSGRYYVKVYANDEEGRTGTFQIDFLVGISEESPTQELRVSPTSWSVITREDRTASKTFTLTNLGTSTATNIGVVIPTSLTGKVSTVSIPTGVAGGGTASLTLSANTANLDEGTYSGTITVTSSRGNASISTSITVVGDLSARADELLDELHGLLPALEDLQNKGQDVSDLLDLYNTTEDSLNQAKEDYLAEDYSSSLSKIEEAESNIEEISSGITGFTTAPTDAGAIIWGVAIVIVVAIVGITVYKFRKKILGMFKKGGKEEEVEEVYTSPEGEYRTEYY